MHDTLRLHTTGTTSTTIAGSMPTKDDRLRDELRQVRRIVAAARDVATLLEADLDGRYVGPSDDLMTRRALVEAFAGWRKLREVPGV